MAEEAEMEEASMTYIGPVVREIVEPAVIPVPDPIPVPEPAAVPVQTKKDDGEVAVPA